MADIERVITVAAPIDLVWLSPRGPPGATVPLGVSGVERVAGYPEGVKVPCRMCGTRKPEGMTCPNPACPSHRRRPLRPTRVRRGRGPGRIPLFGV